MCTKTKIAFQTLTPAPDYKTIGGYAGVDYFGVFVVARWAVHVEGTGYRVQGTGIRRAEP